MKTTKRQILHTLLSQTIAEALAAHSPEQILQGAGIEKAISANMEILRREQVMDFVAGHLVALGAIG